MAIDVGLAKKVLAEIDRDELTQLACDLVNIPSPTGHEKAVAEFILDWFKANGFKAIRQEVEKDRLWQRRFLGVPFGRAFISVRYLEDQAFLKGFSY